MSISFNRYKIFPGEVYTSENDQTYCIDYKHNIIKVPVGELFSFFEINYRWAFPPMKKKDDPGGFYDYIKGHVDTYNKYINNLFDKLAVGSNDKSEFWLYENDLWILPDYQTKEQVMFQNIGIIRIDNNEL
jgi:hypothetical protein